MKRKGSYRSNSRRVYKRRNVTVARPRRLARANRSRIGRRKAAPVHNYSRRDANTVSISIPIGSSAVSYGQTFTLDRLVNATEFQALYDQYKVWKIVLEFKMHTNSYVSQVTDGGAAAALAPVSFPTLYIFNDHDDVSAPTLNDMKERASAKRFLMAPNKIIRWTIRPSILVLGYRSALTNTFSPAYNKWVDMTNMDVPYFGLKCYLDNDGVNVVGQAMVMKMEAKYYFSCKDVR